jgi:glucosamine 6-phosphate synthetase-like amidotransferase/phosphosugar isomerase protein
MCGIIAASSNENINFSRIRLGILMADDRGGHSCGITNEDGRIIKQVSNAKNFINDANCDVKFPRENKSFIAHTRYATQGDKNFKNTHPFSFPKIVGVHNGTLDNYSVLKNKYGESFKTEIAEMEDEEREVEVDSELLYYLIYKHGLKDALNKFSGTLALVYYTNEEGGKFINLYRHNKPLCYGYKDGELWIASLKKYLDTIGCEDIKNVQEHTHYKIKDGSVISAKQLPQDCKPGTSKTQSTDEDPSFEKKERAGDSEQEKEVCEMPEGFLAPKNAKGGFEGDSFVLWWFSSTDHNIIYLELADISTSIYFDLSLKEDVEVLEDDYPSIAQEILDEHAELETINEYRQEHEQVSC